MIPLRNIRRFFYKAYRQPFYAFKVFIKRLKAYFYYSFGDGRSGYPEAITLFLTYRCNLRCRMCGQWGESGVTKKMPKDFVKEELSFEKLGSLIDEASTFNPNVTLFGGEPLLYPRFLDLVKYIKEKDMHCLVITNGSLLGEFAEDLVDAELDELNVSLDGDESLHDEIRGMPGLFERITKGIKAVNQVKKAKGLKRPLINLQCTITKFNYREIDRLAGVAGEVGADSLTYHNLIFIEKELLEKQKPYDELLNASSQEWKGFAFEPGIDPEELYAKVRGILNQKHPLSVDFYPNLSLKGLKEYYNNPSYAPSEYPKRCVSPWIAAYIFPDGEVLPCLNSSYSFGNIKNDRFAKIWNSRKAITFRKTLKEKRLFPLCARCTELYRY